MAEEDARLRLAALRGGYVAKLGIRLDEVRSKLLEAREVGRGSEAWDTAVDVVHRLHGTAGSYGFVAISAELGVIERLLDVDSSSDVRWEDIDTALEVAERAWRTASGT